MSVIFGVMILADRRIHTESYECNERYWTTNTCRNSAHCRHYAESNFCY